MYRLYNLYNVYNLCESVAMALKEYKISEARAKISQIYDRSVKGGPSVISRGSEAGVALLPAEHLAEALAVLAPLAAEVSFDAGGVSAWLVNAPIHASGPDIDAAAAALVEAVRDYADLWESDLHATANHRHQWALVYRVGLLSDEQLAQALFEDPPA